jgi:coenzyme F420 hydrogenase subunit beta
MKLRNLQEVAAFQLCCGCGLCAFLHPEQIRMADSPRFGRRPQFNDDCEDPDKLQFALDLCPGAGLSRSAEASQRNDLVKSLIEKWGAVIGIWEGYAGDPELRFRGSSGGAISALSLYCLEREGMHGVLHTTAEEKKPYLNRTTMSRSRDAIIAAAGSRYSPASPCEKLQKITSAPAPCVFVGKPCDVAATNNARQHIPDLNVKLGLTIACFCAGTPSTNGTLEMLREMGIHSPDNLSTLRYRGCGWPGEAIAEQEAVTGRVCRRLTYQQSWSEILQRYRQWRCYICPDHTGEFADIAVGDPWHRQIAEDEKGRSLILARTETGRKLIERAIKSGYLVAQEADPEILPASQPNLLQTQTMLWGRLLALKLFGAPCPTFHGFSLHSLWRRELTLKEKSLSVLGTVRRIYSKKLNRPQQVFDLPAE